MDERLYSRLSVQDKRQDIFPIHVYWYFFQALLNHFFCDHRQLHVPIHLAGNGVFRKEVLEKTD